MSDKIAKFMACLMCLFIICMSAGCILDTNGIPQSMELATPTDIVQPIDYGNGVLYFPCTNAVFGNSLSAYLDSHIARVQAVSNDGTWGSGATGGYWVVVK